MSETPTFGIDLGTTCSLIGYVRDGQPTLIPIDGNVLMPSVVCFPEDGEPIVGKAALNQLLLMPERTLRSTKRRMGTGHRWQVGERSISASEVATEIVRALMRAAEAETGMKPERVVVTVPAWFPHDARADTRRAAEAAGLVVTRLINEPTAAALAHGHDNPRERRALVYDLGGGTFDASLVHQHGDLIEVRASSGDMHLGGDDLDRRLLSVLMAEIKGSDPELAAVLKTNRGARMRFLAAVQEAKHELSDSLKVTLRCPFLVDLDGEARHLEMPIDREILEAELTELAERSFKCVDAVLKDAGLVPEEVDELLLVGGTSQIPFIWHALKSRYGWAGSAAIPPQETVGLGAAIQAAIVDGGKVRGMLLDVTSHALSIAAVSHGGAHFSCQVIMPRNSPLPGRHTQRYTTLDRHQTCLEIPVLQGSDPNPLRNRPLGTISIDQLPPPPAGFDRRPIAIEFSQDLSGIVSIKLTDELSSRTVNGEIALGGEESSKAREMLRCAVERDGYMPGDGTDPDPFLEREGSSMEHTNSDDEWEASETQDFSPAAPTEEKDLEEARGAFETVLARQDDLVRDHPQHAESLSQIATSGQAALKKGEAQEALAKFDELSDRMFELGVYL